MNISIFHPEGNLENNPNLRAIVITLLAAGYSVTYIHNPQQQYKIELNHEHFLSLCIRPEVPLDVICHSTSLTIGVDEGIITASRVALQSKTPLIFISYEIFYDKELHSFGDIQQKQQMIESCSMVSYAITQDAIRAKSLSKEFSIPKEKIFCIPVAGEGCATYTKKFYLYEQCNIPKDKKILLHMGSITPWSMVPWLKNHAEALPDDWVLVIHDRYGKNGEQYPQQKNCKMYFSTQPLNFYNIENLIQSATACAVLYSPQYNNKYTGQNLAEIGFSSGKLSTSLQYGIPVIVNMPDHIKFIQKYGCGIAIDTNNENPFQQIDTCASISAERCHQAFSQKLDFSLKKEMLLKLLSAAEAVPQITTGTIAQHKTNYQKIVIDHIAKKTSKKRLLFFLVAHYTKLLIFHIKKYISCVTQHF